MSSIAARTSIERGCRVIVPVGAALPSFDGLRPGAASMPPREVDLDDSYYDTSDLSLARWGVTLRRRSGVDVSMWIVELPVEGVGSAVERRVLTFDGASDQVPDGALDILRAMVRSNQLVRVARLQIHRVTTDVSDAEGGLLVQVVDDDASVDDAPGLAVRFREVGVEILAPGKLGRAALKAAAKRLVAASFEVSDQRTTLIPALGPAALEPPDVVVPDLSVEATVEQLITRALCSSVVRLIRSDPGVRVGEDPEGVHQLRVATRRLRSDLQTFASLLDPEWVAGVRAELSWLATEIGRVRDIDVLHATLRRDVAMLPDQDVAHGAMLLDALRSAHCESRAGLLSTMRSDRYEALVGSLVRDCTHPVWAADRSDQLDRPALHITRRLVRRRWKHLAAAVDDLGEDPTDDALHRIRILVKRTRYAAEAALPVASRQAGRWAARLAGLQDLLGEHHDTAIAESWLRAASETNPTLGIVAGQLIQIERARRMELREAWPTAWRRASAARFRTWL